MISPLPRYAPSSGHMKTRSVDLGYYNAESYGISYKVRGLCSNHENMDIMDNVSSAGCKKNE